MTDRDDDFEILRFVTGELDAAGERRFLEACERRPERWRKLALELVEWRTIGALCREETDERAPTGAASAVPVPATGSRWIGFATGFVLAASVAAAVSPFWRPAPLRSDRTIANSPAVPAAAPVFEAANEEPSARQVVQVGLRDGQGRTKAELPLPVYREEEVAEIEDPFREETIVAEDLRAVLSEAGLHVTTERTWLLVPSENGRGLLVPKYSAKLVYQQPSVAKQ